MSPFRASADFTGNWEHFGFEVADGVGTVTFDRPEKLNALTFDVYADLRDLLGEIEHRDDARVLVLTGTGRGFCSGGDVDEIIAPLLEMDARGLLEFTRMTGAVVERIRRLPIPVIAAVNGVAAGAGAVIALAADLRILAESASFSFPSTSQKGNGTGGGVRTFPSSVSITSIPTEVYRSHPRIDSATFPSRLCSSTVTTQAIALFRISRARSGSEMMRFVRSFRVKT